MVTRISKSPEETLAIGEEWARQFGPGVVIGLTGDLGAGKTQLVKGIARGLGSASRVHSPTFTLLNEYTGGRLPLYHLDLYRLDNPDHIISAGLEPYLIQPDGVAVVEWIERWLPQLAGQEPGALPPLPLRRLVHMEVMSETERRISYEDFGS